MRKPVTVIALLGCLAGCVPARIVEADGPRVTYAWNSKETELSRVYSMAISYCDYWNAPPRLVADETVGDQRTSTFACVPRPTLPFGQSPVGRAIEWF
jgi:hypothetical protein